MPSIEVKNLSKSYSRDFSLNEVHFDLVQGEILGLIGPNGSGKTTLMETIAGLLPYKLGQICCEEKEIAITDRKRLLFYLPETLLPYQDQFVIHVLRFVSLMQKSDPTLLDYIVEKLELQSTLKKRVKNLSKGFRRRLLIALAILSPQPFIFLDEPFDGLDLKQVLSVIALLKELKSKGKTLFLAIHQLSDAEKICDRFLLLSSGKVLGEGTLEQLRNVAKLPKGSLEEVFLALT